MSERINPPPIPLPEFDVWEQLGKARDRIRELEEEVAQLKDDAVYCYDLEKQVKAAEAKVARVEGIIDSWIPDSQWGKAADVIRAALQEPEHE